MTPAERVVRAATRAYGETVTEVRPLDLTAAAKPGERHVRPRRRRRFPVWLAPAAAAAAVVALAISLVVVRNIPARPAPASGGSVPRYYAALVPQPPQGFENKLAVGDSSTGARLATLTPARGQSFAVVTAAADDRTFVVATQPIATVAPDDRVPARTWYLLLITPGASSQVRLTRLPIPDLAGDDVLAVALSGSGRELAVGLVPGYATSPRSPIQLQIYSVTTGKLERSWSTSNQTIFGGPGRGGIGSVTTTALTWVDDDRSLAFPTISGANYGKHEAITRETMRLLDVSASGSDLMADSRVIWSTQGVYNPSTEYYGQLSCANTFINPMLSADGKTIVCAAFKPLTSRGPVPSAPGRYALAWLAYSTSAPSVARTVAQLTVDAPKWTSPAVDLQWADSSGGTLIGTWTLETASAGFINPNPPPAYRPHWGVIADGKFRPLTTMGDLNLYSGIAW